MVNELAGQDIGHGVHIRFTGIYGQPDDVKGGLIVAHRHEDGTICEGAVTFDIPEAQKLSGEKWNVLSWDPLTLDPSIQGTEPGCTLHGHIRNGKWEPA